MAGHQHHAADAGRCARAARFGDALHAERRAFGRTRILFERRDTRQLGIDQIKIGKRVREQRVIREAGEPILRRDTRHRDRALGERIRAVPPGVVGRDHGLALADQHAQAHVVALGALAFFNRAVAYLDRHRDRAHRHRIGGIRTCPARRMNKAFGKVDERGLVEQ